MYVCDRARVSPFASSTSRPPKIRHDEVFRSVSFRCSVPFPVSFPFFPFCSLVKQCERKTKKKIGLCFAEFPFVPTPTILTVPPPPPHRTSSSSAKRGLKDVFTRKTQPRQRPDRSRREDLDGER